MAGPLKKSGVFDLCAFCPTLCLDRCPVVWATGSSALSPQSKMTIGWLLSGGADVPVSPEVASTVWECTGCSSCTEACRHDVDVAGALFGLRADLVAGGTRPFERSMFEYDSSELRLAQEKAVESRYFVPGAQAVVFAGCSALLDTPKVTSDLFKTFDELGVEFVGAAPDMALCCGYPLYSAGYRAAFEAQARRVASVFGRYRRIVVLSPCCEYTLRTLYPQVGVDVSSKLVSALDLIAPLVERTSRPPLEGRIAYHDSCFLGRHLGMYDLPRQILTHVLGHPPIELRRNRADSMCCGAGGAWERTSPAGATEAGRNLLEMTKDAGADVLVSGSPKCVAHLRGVAGPATGVEVVDLISLVAQWLVGKIATVRGRRRKRG